MWEPVVHLALAAVSIITGLAFVVFGLLLVECSDTWLSFATRSSRLKRALKWTYGLAVFWGLAAYDVICLAKGDPVDLRVATVQVFGFIGVVLFGLAYLKQRRRAFALQLAKEGREEEAVQLLAGMIRCARRQDPHLHDLLGLVLLNSGEPELAANEFRRALELIPNHPTFMRNLAIALYQLGKTGQALTLLDNAYVGNTDDSEAYLHYKCLFLADAGRVVEARRLLPELERVHQQVRRWSPAERREIDRTLERIQSLCRCESICKSPDDD